jgi:hypothetical protein
MRLCAWIDDHNGQCLASIVSSDTLGQREAATRVFPNRSEARQWIEAEASEIGAEVQWLDWR